MLISFIGGNNLDYSASQRKKLHKDSDDYDSFKDESPKSATSQRSWDSGVGGIGKANTKDRTSTGGYWGDMGQSNRTATKELPDRSRYRHGSESAEVTDRRHDPRLADQAVGGGVYNGVAGTGAHTHKNGRSNQFADHTVHDPLTSGTKGVPVDSDNAYDEDYLPDNSMQSSHNEYPNGGLNSNGLNGSGLNGKGLNGKGLNGRGLNGSGLNNGRGTGSHDWNGATAGYNAFEDNQTGRDNYTYGNRPQPSSFRDGGVPKTSMLDPEPATTASPTHNVTPRAAGGLSSPMSEKSTQGSSGPVPSSTNSIGKKHFGPGHEGAKVMHQCEHCGNDNDISRYFRNDVVYRLGS